MEIVVLEDGSHDVALYDVPTLFEESTGKAIGAL
jgi:hypothetical protein